MARTKTRSDELLEIYDLQGLNAADASIGTGRPITRSTLVRTAQERAHLQQFV